jgi:hypothetical protein
VGRAACDLVIVSRLRSLLDTEAVGQDRAIPLAEVARRLGVHSRRCSEAMAELQATTGAYGSVAGRGYFKLQGADDLALAMRPESNRLAALGRKLRGMGKAALAARVEQLALDLVGGGR